MGTALRKRRLQLGLYLLGCVTVAAIWAQLHGIPGIAHMMAVREELDRTWLTMKHLKQEVAEVPGEMGTLARAENELQTLLENLPREEDIPEVTRNMTRRAGVQGLKVLDTDLEVATLFNAEPEGPGRPVSRLPFRLLVLGSYPEIGRFLEDLAAQGSCLEWTSVTLDRSSSAGGAVEATISMNLYALTRAPEGPGDEDIVMTGMPAPDRVARAWGKQP